MNYPKINEGSCIIILILETIPLIHTPLKRKVRLVGICASHFAGLTEAILVQPKRCTCSLTHVMWNSPWEWYNWRSCSLIPFLWWSLIPFLWWWGCGWVVVGGGSSPPHLPTTKHHGCRMFMHWLHEAVMTVIMSTDLGKVQICTYCGSHQAKLDEHLEPGSMQGKGRSRLIRTWASYLLICHCLSSNDNCRSTYKKTHSFMHSFIHSSIQSFIHSFICENSYCHPHIWEKEKLPKHNSSITALGLGGIFLHLI